MVKIQEKYDEIIEQKEFSENKKIKILKILESLHISLENNLIITILHKNNWHITNTLNEILEIEELILDTEYQKSLSFHNCKRLKEINEKSKDERIYYNEDNNYGNNQIEIKKFSDGYRLIEYYVDGDSDQNRCNSMNIDYCPYCGKELFSEIILDKLTGE